MKSRKHLLPGFCHMCNFFPSSIVYLVEGGEGVKTGDELEQCYNRHRKTVWNICYPYFCNEHDTADAVQETFVRYLQSGKLFWDEDHEKAWLITTARNVCRDELKRAHRKNVPLEAASELPTDLREPDETLAAVQALPEKYRTAIYLFYYEDYPVARIARMLGRRESTVRSDLHRGRLLLEKRLRGAKTE